MADPTLKDVLKAIAGLGAEAATKRDLAALDGKMATKQDVAALDGKMATKRDLAALDAKVDTLRAEMGKRFDDLDAELTTHAKVHRRIEEDITALKGRSPRTAARPTRRPRAR